MRVRLHCPCPEVAPKAASLAAVFRGATRVKNNNAFKTLVILTCINSHICVHSRSSAAKSETLDRWSPSTALTLDFGSLRHRIKLLLTVFTLDFLQ